MGKFEHINKRQKMSQISLSHIDAVQIPTYSKIEIQSHWNNTELILSAGRQNTTPTYLTRCARLKED